VTRTTEPVDGMSGDLLYGEVEEDLRASVHQLLADRCDAAAVLARCETDEPYDLGVWRTLGQELGVAGLLVPEELGGAGAGPREAAVVLEELGRTVAPVPFLGSAVLATSALLGCDDDAAGALAGGTHTGTLAVPLTAAPSAAFPEGVRAEAATLSGRVSSVVDLDVADLVVVPARDADGPALYLVHVPGTGVVLEPVIPLDLTRRIADLSLDGAAGRRVASGETAVAVLHSTLTAAAGLLASEQVGVAQWCLDTTVEYAKARYQFGRPIGSFQAVKHRLADVWAAVSTARATARAAADALATGAEDTALVVAVAAAYCSDAAVLAAEECVQLHGGIGMTWEHPAHLYLGRAKTSQVTFGTPDRHRAAIATLADLPGA